MSSSGVPCAAFRLSAQQVDDFRSRQSRNKRGLHDGAPHSLEARLNRNSNKRRVADTDPGQIYRTLMVIEYGR